MPNRDQRSASGLSGLIGIELSQAKAVGHAGLLWGKDLGKGCCEVCEWCVCSGIVLSFRACLV